MAEDRADLPGLGNRFLIRSEETGGRFALVEHTIPPRNLAAPMHVHEREDEYSWVLAGRMGAQVGDDVVEAGPDGLVRKPRGIPHAFWNPGDEETRLLELISPGGFEHYFEELSPLLMGAGPPDVAAIAELQQRYALSMDMATAQPLMREHGLTGPPRPPPL